MRSRERLLAAWAGRPADYVPLTTWCFGLPAPKPLAWVRDGHQVAYWYSMRMEHIHTLRQPWDLEDDFRRSLAWRTLGVDDVLDVSVPWGIDPEVSWQDSHAAGHDGEILTRKYYTPSGSLQHVVRKTADPGPGWVIQPDYVPLFEDYNIPRAVKHAVSCPTDVPIVGHLYQAPSASARQAFVARMRTVQQFADRHDVAVQAWSAFGMDAVVWLAGPQGAVLMAIDDPHSLHALIEIVAQADFGRTELAASTPGIDMVVERGWYSSTDFWSPGLFNSLVYPHVKELASLVHSYGKLFAYVMSTGVERLGPRLVEAGVDVLYFLDPVQDRLSPERARDLFMGRVTLVGGTNALTLASGDRWRIRDEVRRSIEALGPTNRFVLHPVDALFPDTPWDGVAALIEAWQEYRRP